MSAASSSVPVSPLDTPACVSFLMTPSTRCRTMHGEDFTHQVMFMRFDGLSVNDIAEAMDCDDSVITRTINEWQETLTAALPPQWSPRARNPRRVKATTPQPKKL